jgi:glutamyl-tRNA reductase
MQIGILGINHKSADLNTRELFAKACYKRLELGGEIALEFACVLLFTCHRTEIYFSAEDLAAAHSRLLQLLREEISVSFEHQLYAYFGYDCFLHLALVTAGLDSVIIGESDIQRQVKIAYQRACLYASFPKPMHYLFQKCLQLGKHVRSEHVLTSKQISIPHILYETSCHLFVSKPLPRLLFIGNSEINRKVIAYFRYKGSYEMTLCTRAMHSAEAFSLKFALNLLPWEQMNQWKEYDMLVSGTNVNNFLLHWQESIPKTRLIFDLGVPRNIDPELARHPHTLLLNMDQIGELLEKRQAKESTNFKQIERAVQYKVRTYTTLFQEKSLFQEKLLCVF